MGIINYILYVLKLLLTTKIKPLTCYEINNPIKSTPMFVEIFFIYFNRIFIKI